MLRVLHTSDWHLGHYLHGFSRIYEHQYFLDHLIERLDEQHIDVLIIAGDIFDHANPTAESTRQWYAFLAQAATRRPTLQIVVIGGNHDSAGRLNAPKTLLQALRVTVVGGLPRTPDGEVDHDAMIVPLHNAAGEQEAVCAAMPFLRIADLPQLEEARDPLVEGVAARYRELFQSIRSHTKLPLIATGHAYLAQSKISELSERKILGGNQHALPVSIFPEDLAYVALGHLHKAQTVAGRDTVRYSGSPLPLSMAEKFYKHQVVTFTLEDGELKDLTTHRTPRAVPIIQLPTGDLDAVLEAIAKLDPLDDRPFERRPYLEINLRIDEAAHGLRRHIDEALADKAPRLTKLTLTTAGVEDALAKTHGGAQLHELKPEDVFAAAYANHYGEGEPPADLLKLFHEIVESIHQEHP